MCKGFFSKWRNRKSFVDTGESNQSKAATPLLGWCCLVWTTSREASFGERPSADNPSTWVYTESLLVDVQMNESIWKQLTAKSIEQTCMHAQCTDFIQHAVINNRSSITHNKFTGCQEYSGSEVIVTGLEINGSTVPSWLLYCDWAGVCWLKSFGNGRFLFFGILTSMTHSSVCYLKRDWCCLSGLHKVWQPKTKAKEMSTRACIQNFGRLLNDANSCNEIYIIHMTTLRSP